MKNHVHVVFQHEKEKVRFFLFSQNQVLAALDFDRPSMAGAEVRTSLTERFNQ